MVSRCWFFSFPTLKLHVYTRKAWMISNTDAHTHTRTHTRTHTHTHAHTHASLKSKRGVKRSVQAMMIDDQWEPHGFAFYVRQATSHLRRYVFRVLCVRVCVRVCVHVCVLVCVYVREWESMYMRKVYNTSGKESVCFWERLKRVNVYMRVC